MHRNFGSGSSAISVALPDEKGGCFPVVGKRRKEGNRPLDAVCAVNPDVTSLMRRGSLINSPTLRRGSRYRGSGGLQGGAGGG